MCTFSLLYRSGSIIGIKRKLPLPEKIIIFRTPNQEEKAKKIKNKEYKIETT